jgi:hypothetical protein
MARFFTGLRWPGPVIRVGFPDSGFAWTGDLLASEDGYKESFLERWEPLPESYRGAYRRIWGELEDEFDRLRFKEVEAHSAQIRIAGSSIVKKWGYAFHPGRKGMRSGAIFHDPEIFEVEPKPGTRQYCNLVHEFGHALGLAHAEDHTIQTSVMSQDWPDLDRYPDFFLPYDLGALKVGYKDL